MGECPEASESLHRAMACRNMNKESSSILGVNFFWIGKVQSRLAPLLFLARFQVTIITRWQDE